MRSSATSLTTAVAGRRRSACRRDLLPRGNGPIAERSLRHDTPGLPRRLHFVVEHGFHWDGDAAHGVGGALIGFLGPAKVEIANMAQRQRPGAREGANAVLLRAVET